MALELSPSGQTFSKIDFDDQSWIDSANDIVFDAQFNVERAAYGPWENFEEFARTYRSGRYNHSKPP